MIKRILPPVVLLIAMCIMFFIAGYKHCEKISSVVNDTIVHDDTIPYYLPIPRDSVIVRYITKSVPKTTDSVTEYTENVISKAENVTSEIVITDNGKDSFNVVIPISQKVYTDSLYTAYVSGYEANLDSIFVMRRTMEITRTISKNPPRFGIGIQAGYGITPKGFQPYIGLGAQFNLWTK